MAVSLVVLTTADVVTMMALRQHYVTPVVVTGAEPAAGNWVVGNWFTTTSGVPVSPDTVSAAFARLPFGAYTPSTVACWPATTASSGGRTSRPAAGGSSS